MKLSVEKGRYILTSTLVQAITLNQGNLPNNLRAQRMIKYMAKGTWITNRSFFN